MSRMPWALVFKRHGCLTACSDVMHSLSTPALWTKRLSCYMHMRPVTYISKHGLSYVVRTIQCTESVKGRHLRALQHEFNKWKTKHCELRCGFNRCPG